MQRIDDEVQIRRSAFVVADFTAVARGYERKQGERPAIANVYFEAGFAQGLGKTVIRTVREDCVGDLHFDIRQFSHIVWTDAADLKRRLTARILATITPLPAGVGQAQSST